MSTPGEENRFAAPTASVADVIAAGTLPLANRWLRLGGAIIDSLAVGILGYIVVRILAGLIPTGSPYLATVIATVITFIAFVVVQGYFLATKSQTIGKMLLGMKIVRTDGSTPDVVRLLGMRYGVNYAIYGLIPYIGPLYGLVDALMIFRESHQCLHDNIADTIVIKL